MSSESAAGATLRHRRSKRRARSRRHQQKRDDDDKQEQEDACVWIEHMDIANVQFPTSERREQVCGKIRLQGAALYCNALAYHNPARSLLRSLASNGPVGGRSGESQPFVKSQFRPSSPNLGFVVHCLNPEAVAQR